MLRILKSPSYLPLSKSRRRLRLLLSLLVACLIIPLLFLIRQTYVQLEKESHFLHRHSAETLVEQMNERAQELLKFEENRPIRDYFFLHLSPLSSPAINFSPLSSHPPITATPGVIGYFQLHPNGSLSTPLLPRDLYSASRYGLTPSDIHARMDVLKRVQSILRASARPEVSQQGQDLSGNSWSAELNRFFDELETDVGHFAWTTEKMSELKFHEPYPEISSRSLPPEKIFAKNRRLQAGNSRKAEANYIPTLDPFATAGNGNLVTATTPRQMLPLMPPATRSWPPPQQKKLRPDREGSPNMKSNFSFRILPSGEGLFFRDVRVEGQRYIQGFLVEHAAFLRSIFERPLDSSPLAQNTQLWVGYHNSLLAKYSPEELQTTGDLSHEGLLVLSAGMLPPFEGFELLFSTHLLPASPAKPVVTTLAMIVILVLILGIYLIYGLALNQLELAKQRSDFVSAISHELKTPLTSIRMYGEMLRDGWIKDDTKKKSYYDYIFFESERLSRLISNVLYLTRHTESVPATFKTYTPSGLLSFIESKVASTLQANGFSLNVVVDPGDAQKGTSAKLRVDEDAISQIFINLVDNAIKFSDPEGLKKIDIGYRLLRGKTGKVALFVRDYGLGVKREDRDKIFKLFYRAGDEMTRTTSGTGMGLALVKQMAASMDAEIHYRAVNPGSEFWLEITAGAEAEESKEEPVSESSSS